MQSRMRRHLEFTSAKRAAVTAALLVLPACDRAASDDGVRAGGVSRSTVETQPPAPDPCAWIPATEVEQLIGKLSGPPSRVYSAERAEADAEGEACLYHVADEAIGEIAVQVEMEDATTFEVGSGMAMAAMARELGPDAGTSAGKASPDSAAAWDYEGGIPFRMYVGRVGHMAVQIGYGSVGIAPEKLAELAARVRDRVPDLPVAAPGGAQDSERSGDDPCGLVPRAEAEALLGPLPVAPFRSAESTPFADGAGPSCTYYRGKHRVVVLTPTRSDGKMMFGMAAGLSQRISSVIGAGSEAADTLDGPWDQAGSGIDGALYFLKGDQMLEIQYRAAAIDPAAAVKLAAAAVPRL